MIGIFHYIALGLFLGFAALEVVLAAGGRRFPEVTRWKLKGTAFFLLYFAVATYAPFLWDGWLGQYRLIAADAWPFWAQFAAGFLVLEFGIYAWHRTMHNVQPLWRWFHQMHHSAERLDTWGAFWFSPLDMVGWTALFSLALTLVGLSPSAVFATVCVTTFLSVFQHANVRTPRWLGVLVQRPESHSVHHQRGVHTWNYSDLPVFDLLFGTFRNPREYAEQQGFYDGASARVGDLILWRDVASAPLGRDEKGTFTDFRSAA